MKQIILVLILTTILFADTTEVIIGTPYTGNRIPFWGTTYDAVRFQTLYLQSEINTSGRIVKFAFQPWQTARATYNNFRFYLCQTNVTQLGTTFDDNYGGNTPELIIDSAAFVIDGIGNQWLEWPVSFNYNNTLNLLVEIRWRGDDGNDVFIWRTNEAVPRRVYNMTDDNATTGTTGNQCYQVKLSIESQTGVKEVVAGTDRKPAVLSVNPNPVRTGTNVIFTIPDLKDKTNELSIYDLSGKLIRTLSIDKSRKVVWTLRDNDNKPVAAGVYFVKVGSVKGRITVVH